MFLSFNWLKQYVKLPDSTTAEEVAEKLKLATVEVEKVDVQGAGLDGVVVGKVLSCEKHPNADKLKVCKVDIGETVVIVCGGSNVTEGMLTAVAKVGAKVKWHGEGDLVELKPTAIRGVESFGMICGADEIGLIGMFPKREEKEIVDLKNVSSKPGAPLAEALGLNDAILEIDNKSLSNRPDLWGHYGMAREVAALFNREVEAYKVKEINGDKEIKIKVEVEDTKLCPKYMAVAMSGIKVAESPAWLKECLSAAGLRPINNIVDITNYVMLDLGQPMHAFDARQLTKNKEQLTKANIVVRRAKDGEEFITLDEKTHNLDSSMLVIATEEKAVALAGVMGGLESGIENNTTTIVFESANFDAATTRKTSTKLSLRTDSSARFEKSLDPNMCEAALKRAVELVLECCPGAKVASKVVSEGKPRLFVGPLEIPTEFFGKKLGVEIPVKTIISILTKLGFTIIEKKKFLSVKIPTWRATKDIAIAEDVVEEVARIFGYENIPATLPSFTITPPETNKLRALERTVAETMVKELSYTEAYNYSFVSGTQIAKLGDDVSRYLELDNPISKEKPYIRRNLLPNLLENIASNISNVYGLKLFEIGKVFHSDEAGARVDTNGDELLPRQDVYLTAMYVHKKNTTPFWEVRGIAEILANKLGVQFQFAPADARPLHSWQHPTRTTWLKIGDTIVGRIYELHPNVSATYGIDNRVGVFSLNLAQLSEMNTVGSSSTNYNSLSEFPEVIRDLAFVIKKEITHAEILVALTNVDPLLKKIELFDVFEGKGIGEGYKSMAYHLTYASPEKTLTTAEVDAAQKKVEKILKEKCGAEVRS